jgi:Domain of unknown function (DUF4398)
MSSLHFNYRKLRLRAALVATLSAGALLAACATTSVDPLPAISAAEQAIAAADRARVPDSVSPELSESREKLAAAHAAMSDHHLLEAERLAKESRVDAELASARIDLSKAVAVNDEMKHSTSTLSEEMQRSSGAKP